MREVFQVSHGFDGVCLGSKIAPPSLWNRRRSRC